MHRYEADPTLVEMNLEERMERIAGAMLGSVTNPRATTWAAREGPTIDSGLARLNDSQIDGIWESYLAEHEQGPWSRRDVVIVRPHLKRTFVAGPHS